MEMDIFYIGTDIAMYEGKTYYRVHYIPKGSVIAQKNSLPKEQWEEIRKQAREMNFVIGQFTVGYKNSMKLIAIA